jgi:hypothetical protein
MLGGIRAQRGGASPRPRPGIGGRSTASPSLARDFSIAIAGWEPRGRLRGQLPWRGRCFRGRAGATDATKPHSIPAPIPGSLITRAASGMSVWPSRTALSSTPRPAGRVGPRRRGDRSGRRCGAMLREYGHPSTTPSPIGHRSSYAGADSGGGFPRGRADAGGRLGRPAALALRLGQRSSCSLAGFPSHWSTAKRESQRRGRPGGPARINKEVSRRISAPSRLRYGVGSLDSDGCTEPSMSILPWSSRNGGYRSVISAT